MTGTLLETDVERMVNEVLEESFEVEPAMLRPESHIFDDLGLDSLDIVDLVAALQMKFEARARGAEEVRNIRTLSDIYAFVIRLKTAM